MLRPLILLISLLATPAFAATNPAPQIGIISYWGPKIEDYDDIPNNSLAVINPDNGALISAGQSAKKVRNIAAYRTIASKAKARNVAMLGYVPTGYFRHKCNEIGKCQTWTRIEKQISTYFSETPDIAGIFFDEAAPDPWDCEAFKVEYDSLRKIVQKYRPGAQIVFNAGVPDNCVVNAALPGEITVLFEGDPASYETAFDNLTVSAATAHAKGIKVWHLIHTVKSNEDIPILVTKARKYGADYVYTTFNSGDWQSGVNTWGR